MMRWLALLLVLGVGASCLAAGPGAAAQAADVGRPPVWLAMGDSYASGTGMPGTADESGLLQGVMDCKRANGEGDARAWAVVAYDARWGEAARRENLYFVACTGAITDDWATQVEEASLRWFGGEEPLVDVVSFSFGGNNVEFADVLVDCLDAHLLSWEFALNLVDLDPGCDVDLSQLEARIDLLAGETPSEGVAEQIEGSVTLPELYDSIARLVRPGGHVFVTGYPRILEEYSLWEPWQQVTANCEGIEGFDAPMLRYAVGYLNSRIRGAVEDANGRHPGITFHFIDLADEVYENGTRPGERHGLCSAEPWINGLTTGITNLNVLDLDLGRSFHPKREGHEMSGLYLAGYIAQNVTFTDQVAEEAETVPALLASRGSALFVYDLDGRLTSWQDFGSRVGAVHDGWGGLVLATSADPIGGSAALPDMPSSSIWRLHPDGQQQLLLGAEPGAVGYGLLAVEWYAGAPNVFVLEWQPDGDSAYAADLARYDLASGTYERVPGGERAAEFGIEGGEFYGWGLDSLAVIDGQIWISTRHEVGTQTSVVGGDSGDIVHGDFTTWDWPGTRFVNLHTSLGSQTRQVLGISEPGEQDSKTMPLDPSSGYQVLIDATDSMALLSSADTGYTLVTGLDSEVWESRPFVGPAGLRGFVPIGFQLSEGVSAPSPVPDPIGLSLSPDGLGAGLSFGTPGAVVEAALVQRFGVPTRVDSLLLPYEIEGWWADHPDQPDIWWEYRSGVNLCWDMLCVWLGTDEQGRETFVGWEYAGYWYEVGTPPSPALATARGITFGSTFAEVWEAYPDVRPTWGGGGMVGFNIGWEAPPNPMLPHATGRLDYGTGNGQDLQPEDIPGGVTVLSLGAGSGPSWSE